jgi:hypothetical protein
MTIHTFSFIRKSTLLVAIAWGAIVAVPTAALAQIMMPSIPVPGEEPVNSWGQVSYAHLFKADIDDLGNAKLQRESALAIVGHRFGEPEDKLQFAGQVAYQLSAYNFFNDHLGTQGDRGNLNPKPKNGLQCGAATTGPPNCGGNLWSDVHQFTFLGMATYAIEDDWTLMGGALFRIAGESGADYSEAISGGAFVGFMHKWTDNLSVGMLLGAMTQIEDDAAVLPLPIVNWRMSDHWKLALGVNQLGGVGYGPKVVWAPSKEFDLSLIASYERRRYRLANNNSTKNYIGDETAAPIILQAGWHPTPNIDIGGFFGFVMAGNIRMETQGGNKVFDKSYQPTPTAGFNSTIRF